MMNYIELPFVKMSADAVTLTRATAESAGLDFYSPADYIIPPMVNYWYQPRSNFKFLWDIMAD